MTTTYLCKKCKFFFGYKVNKKIINITATSKYNPGDKTLCIYCMSCNNILGIEISLICQTCWINNKSDDSPGDVINKIQNSHNNFSKNGCKKCLEFNYVSKKFFKREEIVCYEELYSNNKNMVDETKKKYLFANVKYDMCGICYTNIVLINIKCCGNFICGICLEKLNNCPYCVKKLPLTY